MDTPSFAELKQTIEEKQTDKTWMATDSALQYLTTLYRDEPSQLPELNEFLLQVQASIEISLLTERTRLSGTSVALVQQVAESSEKEFLPFVEWMVPAVLKLLTRTNKVTLTRANSCIKAVTHKTKLTELVPYYLEALQSPAKTLRLAMVQQFTIIVDEYPKEDSLAHVSSIETCLRSSAIDSAPEVREASRTLYTSYSRTFPEQLDSFVGSLSEVAKKYLQNNPKVAKPRAKPSSNFKKFMALKNEGSSVSATSSTAGSPKNDSEMASSPTQDTNPESSELGNPMSGPSSGPAQLDTRVNRRDVSIQVKSSRITGALPITNSHSSVSSLPLLPLSSSASEHPIGLKPSSLVSRDLPPSSTCGPIRPASRLTSFRRPTVSSLAKMTSPKVTRASPATLDSARSPRARRAPMKSHRSFAPY